MENEVEVLYKKISSCSLSFQLKMDFVDNNVPVTLSV